MEAVQGVLLRPPLGSSAADIALPACGAVPVLRFITNLDVSGPAARMANRGSGARQPVAAQADARNARDDRPLGTAQRAVATTEPLAPHSANAFATNVGVRASVTTPHKYN